MHISTLKGAVVAALLVAGGASAQTADKPGRMLCPRPTTETIGLKAAPTPFAGDFSAGANAAVQAGVNDPVPNKFFRHTFEWKPRGCCEIMSATLTVKTLSNQAGTTVTASDSANDTIGIVYNGTGVAGLGGYLYPSLPIAIDFPKTTVITMNAAALANMNASNRLSFNLQDDTRVVSAVLEIARCCVGKE